MACYISRLCLPKSMLHLLSPSLPPRALFCAISPLSQQQVHAQSTQSQPQEGEKSAEADPPREEEKPYGHTQKNPHDVAESTHSEWTETGREKDGESLADTGFDMSKKSRPSGDE